MKDIDKAIKITDRELKKAKKAYTYKPRFFVILAVLFVSLGAIIAYAGQLGIEHIQNYKHNQELIDRSVEQIVEESHEEQDEFEKEEYLEYAHEAEFYTTYYCGCERCCGKWSSGREDLAYGCKGDQLTPYYSIAVDPSIVPIGTILVDEEGRSYRAEDTGSMVNGYHVDIFTGNHEEACNNGTGTIKLRWN